MRMALLYVKDSGVTEEIERTEDATNSIPVRWVRMMKGGIIGGKLTVGFVW